MEKILTKHRIRYRQEKNSGAFFPLNFSFFLLSFFISTTFSDAHVGYLVSDQMATRGHMTACNQLPLKVMIYIEKSNYTVIPKINNKTQVLVYSSPGIG